jgi:hypothetical protein
LHFVVQLVASLLVDMTLCPNKLEGRLGWTFLPFAAGAPFALHVAYGVRLKASIHSELIE